MEADTLVLWLFLLLALLTAAYVAALIILSHGLRRVQKAPQSCGKRIAVSVVIAARNEEKTVADCLRSLLSQTYPRELIEILLVDDNSNDATAVVASRFKGIKVLKARTMTGLAPKKAALQTGIEAAKGEVVLTTDADCILPPRWIESMVESLDEQTGLAASWLLVQNDGSMLSRIEQIDSFAYVLIGAALFGLKRPTLANSANLAFRKSAFLEVGGYSGIGGFGSGDDDLLVQKMAAKFRCRFVDGEIVTTKANARLRDFFAQRLRWASKIAAYPPALVLVELFLYFYFALLFCSWIAAPLAPQILLVSAVKFFADYLFLRQEKLPSIDLTPHVFLIAEVVHVLYLLAVGALANLGSYEWKGRTYRRGRLA